MTRQARTAEAPAILNPEPPPEPEIKTFHRRKLLGWNGKVNVDSVHGWVRNRRIDLYMREFEERFGREPSNDEIYEHLRDEPEYQLMGLAKSIAHNGVRVPIILDSEGTLLDGNRRYFATRLAIDKRLAPSEELADIPAWVLTADATDDDKQKVLVEANFLDDFRIEWPNYIKALVLYEDHFDRAVDWDRLAERYGMSKTRIRSMVMAMDLINEFVVHCDDAEDPSKAERATRIAYRDFVLFEEAHNKLRARLDADAEFKEQFFEWMLEEKFHRTGERGRKEGGVTEVRRLSEIRDDQEAWDAIRQDTPDAVKMAIHLVDEKKLPDVQDGEKKVLKVIKILRDLKEWEIDSISRETLLQLRHVLNAVTAMAAAATIQRMGTKDDISKELRKMTEAD